MILLVAVAANLVGRRGAVRAFHAVSPRPPPNGVAPLRQSGARASLSSRIAYFPPSPFPSVATRLKERTRDEDGLDPTWKYVPYRPPPGKRTGNPRGLSTKAKWIVPERIPIPEDRLQVSFARASGAGGQNVNKVNTKVEVRFHVDSADWIPAEVRDRLKSNEPGRINGEGYMTVTSQEHRTQAKNRKDAVRKLEEILRNSWARPKVRKMRKGLTKQAKENRRENKRRNSMKKESRKRVDFP